MPPPHPSPATGNNPAPKEDASFRFSAKILADAAAALFRAAGSPAEEASTVARLLVAANLAGHDSHGVARIPQYLRNLRHGRVAPGRKNTVLGDTGAVVRMSANFGYGQTATLEGVELLAERAAMHNAAAVSVAEMTHNGRQADYCAVGARRGVLTLIFAASSGFNSIVAPFGGLRARMNTNPFAVGIPNGDDPPLVFDIATSATTQGFLRVAADAGEKIPPDLILDSAGAPSVDPLDFYDGGAILPFGERQGYKGYLLNFMVEALGGILTGGGFMGSPKRDSGGQCVLMIGLKVAAFREMDAFKTELDALIGYLKATRPVEGMEVLAPGERSQRTGQRRKREGILLPAVTLAAIQEEMDHYATGIRLESAAMPGDG